MREGGGANIRVCVKNLASSLVGGRGSVLGGHAA